MSAETVWKDRRARTLAGTTLFGTIHAAQLPPMETVWKTVGRKPFGATIRHNHLAETGLEDRWARTLMGTHPSAQPFSNRNISTYMSKVYYNSLYPKIKHSQSSLLSGAVLKS